ncbi:MAG TPA: phytanoyl-CoA dioxygenase family protein [Acidobacteriaceae bacterium]
MKTISSLRNEVLREGFSVMPCVLTTHQVETLISALEEEQKADSLRRRGEVFAIRNLLAASTEVRKLAVSAAMLDLAVEILGPEAAPVRGILFDKTPNANWKVPWHQDATIAVSEKIDLEGYGPWSVKAGVLHVQPPALVLERMLSIRLHLDDCDETNGALKVIPRSHLQGRIPESDASQLGSNGPAVVCEALAGDALLMRPLLLHASSPAVSPRHRRVIHIDYAAMTLPAGLNWASGLNN